MIDDPRLFETSAVEAKRIVFSILDCEKPVIGQGERPCGQAREKRRPMFEGR